MPSVIMWMSLSAKPRSSKRDDQKDYHIDRGSNAVLSGHGNPIVFSKRPAQKNKIEVKLARLVPMHSVRLQGLETEELQR